MFANLYARKGFGRNALVTDTNGLLRMYNELNTYAVKYLLEKIFMNGIGFRLGAA